MTAKSKLASQVRGWRLYAIGALIATAGLIRALPADSVISPTDKILAGIENENHRRRVLLPEYSGNSQYTMENFRFGKQAGVTVLTKYHQVEGESHTVLARTDSERLTGIIDQVLASETSASLPPEKSRHEITAANYRVRLLGSEIAAGRTCYILELAPRTRSRFLIVGNAWVDRESYAVVRIEGQFAASMSILLGTPRISEDFIEVNGFWLPSHVRSVTSSFLLGQTELNILYSNYQF